MSDKSESPPGVMPRVTLAAASKHSVGRVTFMEYDRAMNTYHPCEMPRA